MWEWVVKLKSDTEKFFKDENRIKVVVTKKKGCHGEVLLITSEDFFKILDPKLKKEIDDRNKKIKEEVNGD